MKLCRFATVNWSLANQPAINFSVNLIKSDSKCNLPELMSNILRRCDLCVKHISWSRPFANLVHISREDRGRPGLPGSRRRGPRRPQACSDLCCGEDRCQGQVPSQDRDAFGISSWPQPIISHCSADSCSHKHHPNTVRTRPKHGPNMSHCLPADRSRLRGLTERATGSDF